MRRSILRATALLLLAQALPAVAQVAPGDLDGDGLLNTEEDANGNGVVDGRETDPNRADHDGGGEADGSEVKAGRNPHDMKDDLTYDRDGDGLLNGEELARGTRTDVVDTDGDGASDKDDPYPLDPRYSKDKNQNKIADEWEAKNALPQATKEDAAIDRDNDGLTELQEFSKGTNPLKPDTDGDGETDGKEVEKNADPLAPAGCTDTREAAAFRDAAGHWAAGHMARLQTTTVRGTPIAEGYPSDGGRIFLPDRPITRFELMKILLLGNCAELLDPDDALPSRFSDLAFSWKTAPDKGVRSRVISTAVRLGVIEGYPDGTIRPDAPANRAEVVAMVLRLRAGEGALSPATGSGARAIPDELPFSDVGAGWYLPYLRVAYQRAIVDGFPDGTFRPGQSITRAEAAKLVTLTLLDRK